MARATDSLQHVALLRAINVGGNNKLPMAALVELFVAAGCTNVRTYIQSGNVVYAASAKLARTIPTTIVAAITKKFGFTVPVITRTAVELHAVAKRHPLADAAGADDKLHVAFLADTPAAAAIAALDPTRSPGDTFAVHGRDIYVSFAKGAGTTKLTNAYFDRALATTSTLRNWRTVTTLCAMLKDA